MSTHIVHVRANGWALHQTRNRGRREQNFHKRRSSMPSSSLLLGMIKSVYACFIAQF